MTSPCFHTPNEIGAGGIVEYDLRVTDLGHTELVPTGNCLIHRGPIEYAGWFPGHDDIQED